ncbi:hypothetical protein [Maridesulfovibrio sp.]|uniref:hypothetical protein n=1 Tax=Maridesulfovibrio sp. TaxID=2795000 RepID=UPI002A18CEFB|nr:hypothetical protein [Maridesulfovibrio sp.]
MFKQKEWLFKGESGTEYRFAIFSKSSPVPEYAGIYILAYTHPRGHRAGFETHLLTIGESNNLNAALKIPPHRDCLKDACWNCIYLLEIENQDDRRKILHDLIKRNQPTCQ